VEGILGAVEAVITDMDLLHLVLGVGIAVHRDEGVMALPSTGEDTDLPLADMVDAGTGEHRRPPVTLGTWALMIMVTIADLLLRALTPPAHMALDSNRPAPRLPQVMEIHPWPAFQGVATMHTTRNLIFPGQNHRHPFQELTMALPVLESRRWMLVLGVLKRRGHSHSTASEIVMLMLQGCWQCNKPGHLPARTVKTRAHTFPQGRIGVKEPEETLRMCPRR